jgi:molybdopterin synthase sulfur carrier subunit
MVTIQLFGHVLRDGVGESELAVGIDGPTTVRKLLESNQDRLGPVLEYFNKGEVLVTLNRKVGTQDSAVKDGDIVKLTHQVHHTYEGARWHNP